MEILEIPSGWKQTVSHSYKNQLMVQINSQHALVSHHFVVLIFSDKIDTGLYSK